MSHGTCCRNPWWLGLLDEIVVEMERPAVLNDGVDYSNGSRDCSSYLTDSENGMEDCGLSSTATLPNVEPRGFKRKHGVSDDSSAVWTERRLRSRIHEQFELLRAVVPNLCTDETASILAGAYEYIEKLQREEAELRCELGIESCDEEDLSCCEDEVSSSCREPEERAVDSSTAGCSESSFSYGSNCGCWQPTVEVVRTDEGLRIHIDCEKRPGLLLEIIDLLETSGLSVEEASIEYVERLVFDGIGFEETEENEGESTKPACVSAKVVAASLRSLIRDQTQGNSQPQT